MKKTPAGKPAGVESQDMRSEYRFDYRKARPNRFAGRIDSRHRVVTLDPDVSEVFTTPESVNAVLRALITTMPKRKVHKPLRKSSSATTSKERG